MTAYESWLPAHFARYVNSGTSVIYWLTSMLGLGKTGRAPWLQYALRTVDAEAWSSVAVEPHLDLTDDDTDDTIFAKMPSLLQTHDCSASVASGQAEYVLKTPSQLRPALPARGGSSLTG